MECLQNKIMFTINTQSNKNLRQTDIHTHTDRYLGINRGFTGVRIVKKHWIPIPIRCLKVKKRWMRIGRVYHNLKDTARVRPEKKQTHKEANRHTDRQIDRQTDSHTDRQTDTQTDRNTDTQTDAHTPGWTLQCLRRRYRMNRLKSKRNVTSKFQTERHMQTKRQTNTPTTSQTKTQTNRHADKQTLTDLGGLFNDYADVIA